MEHVTRRIGLQRALSERCRHQPSPLARRGALTTKQAEERAVASRAALAAARCPPQALAGRRVRIAERGPAAAALQLLRSAVVKRRGEPTQAAARVGPRA